MPLHPLAQRFAEVAEDYERARPGHPPAVALDVNTQITLAARE